MTSVAYLARLSRHRQIDSFLLQSFFASVTYLAMNSRDLQADCPFCHSSWWQYSLIWQCLWVLPSRNHFLPQSLMIGFLYLVTLSTTNQIPITASSLLAGLLIWCTIQAWLNRFPFLFHSLILGFLTWRHSLSTTDSLFHSVLDRKGHLHDDIFRSLPFLPQTLKAGDPFLVTLSGHHYATMQISLAASVVNDGGVYLAMLLSTPKQIPLSVSGLGSNTWWYLGGTTKQFPPFSQSWCQILLTWRMFPYTIKQISLSASFVDVIGHVPGNTFQTLLSRFFFMPQSLMLRSLTDNLFRNHQTGTAFAPHSLMLGVAYLAMFSGCCKEDSPFCFSPWWRR